MRGAPAGAPRARTASRAAGCARAGARPGEPWSSARAFRGGLRRRHRARAWVRRSERSVVSSRRRSCASASRAYAAERAASRRSAYADQPPAHSPIRCDLGSISAIRVDGGVEEGPVVRDEDDRAPVAPDERLQALEAVRVQVVRRLVEEQEIGAREKRCRQRRPGRLAAGEARRAGARGRPPGRARRRASPRAARGHLRRGRGAGRARGRTASKRLTRRGRGRAPTRRPRARAPRPRSRSAAPSGSISVSPGSASGSCGTCATVRSRRVEDRPSRDPAPPCPASSRRTVDLPTPFGPTRPMRPRGSTASDASSRTTCPPWYLVTPTSCARMRWTS